jgi:hypothetical protein
VIWIYRFQLTNRVAMILEFLAERIGEAGEPAR